MFKPRTFRQTLYQGDYQQRIAEAAQAVEDAKKRAKDGTTLPRLMGEQDEVAILTDQHNELVAEAEAEGSLVVVLQALGRKAWAAMVDAHPPRTGDDTPKAKRDSDEAAGVNEDTFSEALLESSIVETGDEALSVTELLDAISSHQYMLLYYTAFQLNRDGGPSPKTMPSVEPSRSSGGTEN